MHERDHTIRVMRIIPLRFQKSKQSIDIAFVSRKRTKETKKPELVEIFLDTSDRRQAAIKLRLSKNICCAFAWKLLVSFLGLFICILFIQIPKISKKRHFG